MNTRVSTRGRIVIPVSMRQKLNIRPDTPIYIEVDEPTKRIILTPITRQYVSRLRGKYKGRGVLKALMDEKKHEREK